MPIDKNQFFDQNFNDQFPQLAGDLRQTIDEAFPSGGLDAQQVSNLNSLQDRAARLKQLDQIQPQGSTAIPGNPFSYDISPAINAVQDALVKGINAVRQRRLLKNDPEKIKKFSKQATNLKTQADQLAKAGKGNAAALIPSEYSDLYKNMGKDAVVKAMRSKADNLMNQADQNKSVMSRISELKKIESNAKENKKVKEDILKRMYPEVAGKLIDLQSSLKKKSVDQTNDIKKMREKTTQAIKQYNQTKGKDGNGNHKNPKNAVGVVTGFIGQVDPYVKSITSTIQKLESQKVAFPDKVSELDKRIKNLKAERGSFKRWQSDAYEALANGNLYDKNLIDRYNALVNAGAKSDETGKSFVQEMMDWAKKNNTNYSAPDGAAASDSSQVHTGAFN